MVNLEVDFAAFAQTTSPPRLLLKPSKTHKTLGLHQARVEEPNRNKGKQQKQQVENTVIEKTEMQDI